ncbi:MAG: phosphoglycerate dehydrogenase [Candidatus Tectomicrobia bacterium]|nr:phosphoglycerate dehydrogenase [Candidatus Tectomicrobia bacterium]
MKPRIVISTSSFGVMSRRPLELLEAFGAEYALNPYGRKLRAEESMELLREAHGVIAGTERLDRAVLEQAPRLRIISRCGTGVDNIDLEAAAERGLRVCTTPEAPVDGAAEVTLAGMLNVLRRLGEADRRLRAGAWEKPMGGLLRGRTVGIIGLGRVGKAVVKLLQPFAVRLLAFDPQRDDAFAAQYGVSYTDFAKVVQEAEILTLHCAYSPTLHHLLDRATLSVMKPGAILVNCARGGLVDEQALYELLRAGRLAGAYLDTFELEPYVGPLTELPNVLLSPHIGSYAAECRVRMEVEAVENVLRFFRNERGA